MYDKPFLSQLDLNKCSDFQRKMVSMIAERIDQPEINLDNDKTTLSAIEDGMVVAKIASSKRTCSRIDIQISHNPLVQISCGVNVDYELSEDNIPSSMKIEDYSILIIDAILKGNLVEELYYKGKTFYGSKSELKVNENVLYTKRFFLIYYINIFQRPRIEVASYDSYLTKQ